MTAKYKIVADMVNNGMKVPQIAKAMGISSERANGLRSYALRIGLIQRSETPMYVRVAEMYKSWLSCEQIGNKLGKNIEQVRRTLSYARNVGAIDEFQSKGYGVAGFQIGSTRHEFNGLSPEVREWFLGQMDPKDSLASAAFDLVVEAYYREMEQA